MPTILLHPYVPGLRPADQAPCWEGLHEVQIDTAVQVFHARCQGPYSYAQALTSVFGQGYDVAIVEHDIAVVPFQIVEMEVCPEDFCAFDYRVSKHKCWGQVKGATSFGLCRISVRAQSEIVARPRVPQVPWRDLASELGKRLPPVHMHYPLADHRHHYA